MYKVLKNVRLNHVTYEKGSIVSSIPNPKYSHCFEKVKETKKVGVKEVETASKKPKSEKR